jgi:quercetin dioxygenase-like cupin family protein
MTRPYWPRLDIPSGTTFPPHAHPQDQFVTVLKGTLLIGYGENPDLTKMYTVSAGGFRVIEAFRIHYEQSSEETLVRIHGMGPLKTEKIIKPTR